MIDLVLIVIRINMQLAPCVSHYYYYLVSIFIIARWHGLYHTAIILLFLQHVETVDEYFCQLNDL